MKKNLLLVVAIVFVCAGALAQAANPPVSKQTADHVNIQLVIEEIRRCPSWTVFRADEREFRAGVTRLYFEIAAFDNQTIRTALQQLLSEIEPGSNERFQTDAKVFALLRVLFEIPSGFIVAGGNYGSWGNPVSEGRVNLLWPYEIDPHGKFVLRGTGGHYFGPPYDALAEFDEFAARFVRRKISF